MFANGRPAQGEVALDTPDGRRWLSLRCVPERDADGRPGEVLAIIGDVSERRRIASTLAERERGLESALDEVDTLYRNLPVGLCVVDRRRRLLRVNEELAAVADDSAGRLVGRCLDALHPLFAERVSPLLDMVFEGGASTLGHELEGAFGRGGEHRHWVVDLLPLGDPHGGTRAASCTVQDITARKLTEQRLAARAAVAEVLVSARDLDAAMTPLLDGLADVFDADVAECWRPDAASGSSALRRTHRRARRPPVRAHRWPAPPRRHPTTA